MFGQTDGTERPAILTLTDGAVERAKRLMEKAGEDAIGIRVGVKSGGCSGLTYFVEYATETKKFEDVIETNGVKVLVDPKAVMYLLGSEMDYEETKFSSGFTFRNPNETDRCGCGESFRIG